jgi:hypothetical protein
VRCSDSVSFQKYLRRGPRVSRTPAHGPDLKFEPRMILLITCPRDHLRAITRTLRLRWNKPKALVFSPVDGAPSIWV